ncbi:MAG: GNAT family N-acetyltransferase [Henriciella sp.]|jgi:RimJ/RimL family protein N-acetyltransferase
MAETRSIPLTRHAVSDEVARRIRDAVRMAEALPGAGGGSRAVRAQDGDALTHFFEDPAIHLPIYSIPRPVTAETVRHFIQAHIEEKGRGEGGLFLSFFDDGRVAGYSDIQIWPHWAAGELGGALHPERQSQGHGVLGAARSFDWMFQVLGLELICETASRENIRTAKLLDALGFALMGEVISYRPDGSSRPSRVWEINRETWEVLRAHRVKRFGEG